MILPTGARHGMAQKKVKVKTNFEVEKVGRKNSVIWNCNDSDSIHVDQNHTDSNKQFTSDYTYIGPIHDSSDISAIEKILSLEVNLVQKPSLVPASPIFTYGTSRDP